MNGRGRTGQGHKLGGRLKGHPCQQFLAENLCSVMEALVGQDLLQEGQLVSEHDLNIGRGQWYGGCDKIIA